jgi:dCTP deaminase
VHFTAPTIHAGYEGTITLEIINHGPFHILLYPNMRICQLIVEQVGGVPEAKKSQFHGQIRPGGQTT